MKMKPTALVTIPPYASYTAEVLRHPVVSGVRLNTVMPIKGALEDALGKLQQAAQKENKELWIDLKCRQLRIKTYGVPPFTEIELTHNITVNTPVTAYFKDGQEQATVLEVDGNRLIMQEGPRRVVGPGESVNIVHPSLKIDGYFTEKDLEYINTAKKIGLHNYMLSFVEQESDLQDLLQLDPQANIVAKIESQRGLDYIANNWSGTGRLMAARGDLYVELKKPHQIIQAVENILQKDPTAVVASRIFPSLSESLEPSCTDIGDVDNLLRMGYRTIMLGDDICQHRNSAISALNLLEAMTNSKYTTAK